MSSRVHRAASWRGWLAIAVAQALGATAATAASPAADPADLGAFLDGFMAAKMPAFHATGAVFVWVEDGAQRFARGWGVADRETGERVDPARTLFRVASISKLYTATAAVQLRDRGLLERSVVAVAADHCDCRCGSWAVRNDASSHALCGLRPSAANDRSESARL